MNAIKITWTTIKNLSITKFINLQYIEELNYTIYLVDEGLSFYCVIFKETPANDDQVDFETNFKSKCNKKLTSNSILTGVNEPNGYRARLIGIYNQLVTAGVVTSLDWKIPQLTYQTVNKISYFDGIHFFTKDSILGDTIKFQVVDKDNILGYGAGFIVEEFGDNFGVIPNQLTEIKLYKAKLITNLYIRLVYNSTGGVNVHVMCNIFRHLDQYS